MIFALIPSRQEVDRYPSTKEDERWIPVLGKPVDLLSLVHAEIRAAKDLGGALDQSERGSGDRRLRDRRRCLEGSPRNTKVPPTVAPTTTIDAARATKEAASGPLPTHTTASFRRARAAPTSSPQVEYLPARRLRESCRREEIVEGGGKLGPVIGSRDGGSFRCAYTTASSLSRSVGAHRRGTLRRRTRALQRSARPSTAPPLICSGGT